MTEYVWRARTVSGDVQTGELEAESEGAVIGQLRRSRLVPLSVKPKPRDISFSFGERVGIKDLVIFTRQFATMINAGLPLVQSLDILGQQTEKKGFAGRVKQVLNDVESGNTLADSMRRHPKVFSELFVNMVAAGEAGGILDVILLRLAEYMEKAEKLRRKVKGAMFYPATVMGFAAMAIAVLLIFVIPTFAGFFIGAGVALPLPTRIVIGASQFLLGWWWAVGLALGGLFYGIKKWKATPAGGVTFDRILLGVPVLGNVVRKSSIARFARTLGTLTASGVPILEGLEITARTSGNKVVENAILESRVSIAGGDTISEPLRKSEVFPPMVVQMINVGEQTGGLDEMLNKVADFYDSEVDSAVDAMTSVIEPIMIVFLGVVVGGMVVAMYLPIFDIIKTVE
ncbi:MAG: type II secretion system F family protein [Gemmatimonadetes bacterium]|nr:type II secretion system F family protein [Gemmatimonadota bacterium]